MIRGRPLEFDPQQALDAAVEVFWSKGYEATSMNDLLGAMALSKSSLYQTFGGKRQLFLRCLGRYQERFSAEMRGALQSAPSGLRFISGVFENVANTAEKCEGAKGCLVANSASEFGQRDMGLSKSVGRGLQGMGQIFIEALQRAQREGDLSTKADVNVLANYLVGAMTGLRTMIKAGLSKVEARSMVPVILNSIR
ncbi:MAG: TetR/AcrR family transcriptional regulator [Nitrospira sp.]|nr:TetR/AcrR family transcriptional regulator [Nitrospira sp.]